MWKIFFTSHLQGQPVPSWLCEHTCHIKEFGRAFQTALELSVEVAAMVNKSSRKTEGAVCTGSETRALGRTKTVGWGLRQGRTQELGCQPVMENHERALSRKVTQPDCILERSFWLWFRR